MSSRLIKLTQNDKKSLNKKSPETLQSKNAKKKFKKKVKKKKVKNTATSI